MKRFLSTILVMMFSLSIMAQFNFNPNIENSATYRMGYGHGLFSGGNRLLCEGDYDKAFSIFQKGTQYTAENWCGLGICYELGFGTEVDYNEAVECYSTGADEGDQACKMALQRINGDGFYSSKDRKRYIQNLRIITGYNSAGTGAGIGGGSVGTFGSGGNIYGGSSNGGNYNNGGSSGGSRSDGYTCPTCHGTGRCTSCAGRGEWRGSDGRLYDCNMCHGGGSCYGCHGRGRIR